MDNLDTTELTAFINEGDEERRSRRRFPIQMEVRYRAVRRGRNEPKWAVAQTLDISSSGLLINAPLPFPEGSSIQLSLDWPVLMGGHFPMTLLVAGRIVRSGPQGTAIRIERHDFVPVAFDESTARLPHPVRKANEKRSGCPP